MSDATENTDPTMPGPEGSAVEGAAVEGFSAADTSDIASLSYEQARSELVETVTRLETGGAGLEESLALWERGEALADRCEEWLNGARAKLDEVRARVAGTDAGIFTNIPGSAMTRELELLVKAGLTPYEALQTATVNAGEVLGFEKTGVIAPGYRANMILVEGDPLEDVSFVENPSAVMIGGKWLDADKLADLRKGAAQTSIPRTARRAIAMLRDL